MKKKFLTVFLATTMICSLFTACGDTNISGNTENDGVFIDAEDSTTDKREEPKDYFTQLGLELTPNMSVGQNVYFIPKGFKRNGISMDEGYIQGEFLLVDYTNTTHIDYFYDYKDEKKQKLKEEYDNYVDNNTAIKEYHLYAFDKYTGTVFKDGLNVLTLNDKEYNIIIGEIERVGAFDYESIDIYVSYPEEYDGLIIFGTAQFCKCDESIFENNDVVKIDKTQWMDREYNEETNEWESVKKSFDELKDTAFQFYSLDNTDKIYSEAPDFNMSYEKTEENDYYNDIDDAFLGFDMIEDKNGINYLVYREDNSIYYPGDIIPGGVIWIGATLEDFQYMNQ